MKKTFVFDAVHTILRPMPDVISAYFLAGKRHGSAIAKNDVKRRFREGRRKVFGTSVSAKETKRGALPSSDHIEFQLWSELVAHVFEDVHPIGELFQKLWEHFASPANWQLYDDVDSCFNSIKAAGHQIVVASNFDTRLLEILERQPCCQLIDRVYCSAAVGYRKPDPMFYEVVSRSSGFDDPSSIVMVGDDFQNDYVAPRMHGWNALHLNRQTSEPSGEYEIADLNSVSGCL